MICSCILQIA